MVEVEAPGDPEEIAEMTGAASAVVKVWSLEVDVWPLPLIDTTA